MGKKKKAVVEKEEKQSFYVSISSPSSVQGPLLESQRDLLEGMRLFTQLKSIRRQKMRYKVQLRKQLSDIMKYINVIRNTIPTISIDEEPALPPRPVQIVPVEPKAPAAPPPVTDMDRIERGLREIESKLSQLR